ncbi:Mechanosensitive ion channel protein 10 [Smittium culicis]|uniref:Mechanosensitive ion channel protein 10 n=1 Tax=Smittium culicis TaxID=133412 RepID=A0A1R1XSD2_9FUNG|nr:Mechanosensitive ion channel protein 10 [Smittium culicis]
MFDSGKNGNVSKEEFIQTFINCQFEKKVLSNSLVDMSKIIRKVHKFFVVLIIAVTLVISTMVFSMDIIKSVAPLATLIFALSFVFGNSCKNTFECFVFLFMSHPYDVGDHLKIDNNNLFVKKINLLNTIFTHPNGQNYTIPNNVLSNKVIINFRRSDNQKELYEMGINFDTPLEKIEILTKKMTAFVEDCPLEYKPGVFIRYMDMKKCSLLNVSIGVTYRNNWQDIGFYWKSRNKFVSKLRSEIVALGLTYSTEVNNINIVSSDGVSKALMS